MPTLSNSLVSVITRKLRFIRTVKQVLDVDPLATGRIYFYFEPETGEIVVEVTRRGEWVVEEHPIGIPDTMAGLEQLLACLVRCVDQGRASAANFNRMRKQVEAYRVHPDAKLFKVQPNVLLFSQYSH